ncbi:MAG TPA: BON domain-containing protein [Chryseosolibacter sp.]|nr:BON domain-containing protein [Chryseosolibacter sp.]
MENNKSRNDQSSLDDKRQQEQQRVEMRENVSRYGRKDSITSRDLDHAFPESGVNRDQRNLHSQREQPRGPEGYRRSDQRIREVITDLLTSEDDLDTSDFEVRVNEASVTLQGYIPDDASRRRINEVIERVPGIRKVNDELRINPHAKQ